MSAYKSISDYTPVELNDYMCELAYESDEAERMSQHFDREAAELKLESEAYGLFLTQEQHDQFDIFENFGFKPRQVGGSPDKVVVNCRCNDTIYPRINTWVTCDPGAENTMIVTFLDYNLLDVPF